MKITIHINEFTMGCILTAALAVVVLCARASMGWAWTLAALWALIIWLVLIGVSYDHRGQEKEGRADESPKGY